MCGICGYCSKKRISVSELEMMNNTMYHRGPNDAGVWEDISSELREVQQENIKKVFGGRTIEELTGIPFGKCDDIIIIFQHFKTFDEAKGKWNLRKRRVNINNCGFLLVVDSECLDEAREFDLSDLGKKRNKVIITYDPVAETTTVIPTGKIPQGEHFMARHNLIFKHYEVNFNPIKWLNGLR